MTRRDPYAAVGEATRAVLRAAAQADPPLRPREWRVLSAVLEFTTTWSRLSDDVSHGALGAAAGFDMDTTSARRNFRRDLRDLANRGLIVYEPGRSTPNGTRVASSVGLPTPPAEATDSDLTTGGPDRPGVGTDPGSETAPTGGRSRHGPGVGTDPPPEKGPEEVTEEVGADAPTTTTEVEVKLLKVDEFDEPVPVAGDTLTDDLVAWAVAQRLAPDPAPVGAVERARIAVTVLHDVVGSPAAARASSRAPTAAVIGELVDDVSGDRPDPLLITGLSRLLAKHKATDVVDAVMIAMRQGAGLTGRHVGDPTAIAKYAGSVLENRAKDPTEPPRHASRRPSVPVDTPDCASCGGSGWAGVTGSGQGQGEGIPCLECQEVPRAS